MKMRFLLLFLITFLCAFFSSAEESGITEELDPDLINELVNLESMLLNIKTSTNIDLIIEGDNPKLELLEINQSFIPLNSDFQEIKQFSLFPNNIETSFDDKSAIFKIKGIKKTNYQVGIDSVVKTNFIQPRIRSKIPFPFVVTNPDILKYTRETKNIDSNDESIKKKANELVKGEDDLFIVVSKIATWVEENIEYSLNSLTEKTTQKSSWVLKSGNGVCDELTSLFIAMLRSQGVPARYISGMAYTNFNDLNNWGPHAWAEVYFDKYGWVPFDITYHEFGFLDATHIKFKESVDSSESTSNFKWLNNNVELKIDPMTIQVDSSDKGNIVIDGVSVTANAMEQNVGLNSYNLIEVDVKNNDNFYRTYDVYLTYSDILNLTDGNHRAVILKPLEQKKVYFMIKTQSGLDEDYIYKIPLVVYTQLNDKAEILITAKSSFSNIEKSKVIDRISSNSVETSNNGKLELYCYSQKYDYKDSDDIKINCDISSKLESPVLTFCTENNCKSILYPENKLQEKTFNFENSNPGRKQINFFIKNNGDISKDTVYLNIGESPKLYVKEKVNYDLNNNLITFQINKLSENNPKNVQIKLYNLNWNKNNYLNKWDFETYDKNQKLNLYINGNEILHGENKLLLLIDYEDADGKKYQVKDEVVISVEKGLFTRIVDTFLRLFSFF